MDKSDLGRIEWFRQFKKEIRGSTEYLVVGIDIAKEKHHGFFGTANGKTLLKRLIFDNSREGFEKLEIQVEHYRCATGCRGWCTGWSRRRITISPWEST